MDLLLGSTISVDKPFFLHRIIDLSRIVCCERSVILPRISWDQKMELFTGTGKYESCYWDNNRLSPGIKQTYPQLIAGKMNKQGHYLQNYRGFYYVGSQNQRLPEVFSSAIISNFLSTPLRDLPGSHVPARQYPDDHQAV
ncbi:hypothetical protein EH228_05390 [Erwinia endophytica]|nr:hypothetical protein EH228_05390 [Erwinia endophytica]